MTIDTKTLQNRKKRGKSEREACIVTRRCKEGSNVARCPTVICEGIESREKRTLKRTIPPSYIHDRFSQAKGGGEKLKHVHVEEKKTSFAYAFAVVASSNVFGKLHKEKASDVSAVFFIWQG